MSGRGNGSGRGSGAGVGRGGTAAGRGPCKDGANCARRPGCWFTHPGEEHVGAADPAAGGRGGTGIIAGAGAGRGGTTAGRGPCKDGANCARRPGCWFTHPGEEHVGAAAAAAGGRGGTGIIAGAGAGRGGTTAGRGPCKDGTNCARRPGCWFTHPGEEYVGAAAAAGGLVSRSTSVTGGGGGWGPCKDGAGCIRLGCRFTHPGDGPGSGGGGRARRGGGGTKPCIKGVDCPRKNTDCTFNHTICSKVGCVDVFCNYIHPEGSGRLQCCRERKNCPYSNCPLLHADRNMVCPTAAAAAASVGSCDNPLCQMLHLGSAVDLMLQQPPATGMRHVVIDIVQARMDHRKKIHTARQKMLRSQQELAVPGQRVVAASVELQQLEELELQLASFDRVVQSVWGKLQGREARHVQAVGAAIDAAAAAEVRLPIPPFPRGNTDIGSGTGSVPPVPVAARVQRMPSSIEEVGGNEARLRIYREIYRLKSGLPAYALQYEICEQIRDHSSVVIRGMTGSGKSTQVPQYLAEMVRFGQLDGKKILCTQPRKIAAEALAARVSEEWDRKHAKDKVGFTVGFRVGGLAKSSHCTLIEYLTEGSLLSSLLLHNKRNNGIRTAAAAASVDKQHGAETETGGIVKSRRHVLDNVAAVILDEAHERTVTLDVLVGVLLDGQRDGRWPNLKIIVTSATLDVGLFSKYLGTAPVIEIPGRMFPVDVVYRPLENGSSDYVKAAVAMALEIHTRTSIDSGDILVFLTAEAECLQAVEQFRRTMDKMHQMSAELRERLFVALPLYGRQQREEQQPVLNKAPAGTRKVVFSTDVAETSMTLDGVTHVIDSGMTKESVFDPKRNITVLETRQISLSSATQRKGRAGRTAPGTCYRLYSADEEAAMNNTRTAEILSKPLDQTVVTIRAMNLDPLTFNWIENPDLQAMRAAENELRYLGAIDPVTNTLTEIGLLAAELQAEPSLARMLYCGCRDGTGQAAALVAGVLSVGTSIFFRPSAAKTDKNLLEKVREKHAAFGNAAQGDVVSLYRVFEAFQSLLNGSVDRKTAAVAERKKTAGGAGARTGGGAGVIEKDGDDDDDDDDDDATSVLTSTTYQTGTVYDADDDDVSDLAKGLLSLNVNDEGGNVNEGRINIGTGAGTGTGAGAGEFKRVYNLNDRAEIENEEWLGRGEGKSAGGSGHDPAAARWEDEAGSISYDGDGSIASQSVDDNESLAGSDISEASVLTAADSIDGDDQQVAAQELQETKEAEAAELRMNKAARSKASKQWCAENYLNSKSLGIAAAAVRDFIRAAKSVGIFKGEQGKPLSDDGVRRLVARGYFLNVAAMDTKAVRSRMADYNVLRTEQASRGVFHPSSTVAAEWYRLKAIEDKDEGTMDGHVVRAASVLPKWVCYHSIMQTSRTFLSVVTPIEEEWLQEESGVFYERVRERKGLLPAGFPIDNVPQGAFRRLIRGGYQGQGLSKLAAHVGASELLEDLASSRVVAWAREMDHTRVEEKLRAALANELEKAQREVIEEAITPAVRACYGAGGEVKCILFPGECISLNVRNLAIGTTVADLKAIADLHGHVHDCSITEVTNNESGTHVYGKIVYTHKRDAAAALTKLGSTSVELNGSIIQVQPGGVKSSSNLSNNAIKARLVLSWSLLPSSGSARVSYSSVEKAQQAVMILSRSGMLAKLSNPITRCIFVNRLQPGADEFDVEQIMVMKGCPRSQWVSIKRVDAAAAATAAAEQQPLSVELTKVTNILPFRDRIVSAKSSFTNQNTRAQIEVQYDDSIDIETALLQWRQAREEEIRQGMPERLWAGQRMRMQTVYSCKMNFEGELLKPFEYQIQLSLSALNEEHGNLSFDISPGAWKGGKFFVRITALALNVLNIAMLCIDQLLAGADFHISSDLHREVIFSHKGFKHLQSMIKQASKQQSDHARHVVLCNQQKRFIRVYGDEATRAVAIQTLAQCVQKITAGIVKETKFMKTHRGGIGILKRRIQLVEQFNLVSLLIGGQKLTIIGAQENVDQLKGHLADQLTDEAPVMKRATGERDEEVSCGLCFCEVSDPFELAACSHTFCTPCVQHMFDSAENRTDVAIPVRCPHEGCTTLCAWSDIPLLASNAGVDFIKSSSVSQYILHSGDSIRRCLNPACEGLIDMSSTVTAALGNMQDQSKLGGQTVVVCHTCANSYCLECSERDVQPVRKHTGLKCDMAGKADRVDIRTHVARIADMMNLKCPRCKTVFVDYNGCAALTCSNGGCNCGFCACCLKDCGSDAHSHVRQCSENPTPNDYFPPQPQVDRLHATRRANDVRTYLNTRISDPNLRAEVSEMAKGMLAELQVVL